MIAYTEPMLMPLIRYCRILILFLSFPTAYDSSRRSSCSHGLSKGFVNKRNDKINFTNPKTHIYLKMRMIQNAWDGKVTLPIPKCINL